MIATGKVTNAGIYITVCVVGNCVLSLEKAKFTH